MEKQTKHPPLRWLLGLLLCCVAFGAQAQTVEIEGYTSVGAYDGYPLFKVDSSPITVSSTSGSFYYIYIDDIQVAFNSSSYWSSYSLDISSYLDGGYHKLQLKRGSSNYGICYFTNSAGQVSIDGIEYGLTNNNIAAVIGSADDVEEANIPATISKDGVEYSVKSISTAAFANRTKLHTVTIPESVTRISNSAFKGYSALTTLNFNAINCTRCGSSDVQAFPSTITNLTIGEKVTTIPDYFLHNGSKIENLTIPESVTNIGKFAFSGCSALTTLNFNAINCESFTSLCFPSTIAKLTIGDKVTKIPDNFLRNGSKIENLTIPNSVTSIGSCAFGNSYPLKSLTLGAGIITIDCNAFNSRIIKVFWLGNTPPEGYENIDGLVNYVANNQYSLNNQVKYQFLSSKFTVDGTVYVPVSQSERTCDVVDCIYDESFAELKITDNVVDKGIKMTVNNIQQYAFYDNKYITKVELLNKGDIGAVAFLGCSNLGTATIANEGHIGDKAFYELTKLGQVTLGDKVTELGTEAFYGCTALTEIIIPNSVASLGSSVFTGCSSLSNVNIGTNVSAVPQGAFAACTALEHITIPRNVALIRDYAFYECSKLSDVTIEDGNDANDILTLGSNGGGPLFNDCPLDEVYIGRKLSYKTGSSYDYSPFYRNISLRSVVITDSETEIYDNEFYGCSNLKSLQIGNGVKRIGNRAFSGCSALDYFSAGCKVQTIGAEAFSDCTGLTKFYSHSKLPPVCGEQALDDINKWECTLYVPEQSSDEYRAAPQWKDFFFIEESTDAGVGSVLVGNDAEMEAYDLKGRMVGTSLEGLKAGIYIVKQGGTTSKVAIN